MVWRIEFDPAAFEELRALDPGAQKRICRYIVERLATPDDPRRFGKPLRQELKNLWRYRIGDFRLICDIREGAHIIVILRVGDRKNIYN